MLSYYFTTANVGARSTAKQSVLCELCSEPAVRFFFFLVEPAVGVVCLLSVRARTAAAALALLGPCMGAIYETLALALQVAVGYI